MKPGVHNPIALRWVSHRENKSSQVTEISSTSLPERDNTVSRVHGRSGEVAVVVTKSLSL